MQVGRAVHFLHFRYFLSSERQCTVKASRFVCLGLLRQGGADAVVQWEINWIVIMNFVWYLMI